MPNWPYPQRLRHPRSARMTEMRDLKKKDISTVEM